MAEDHSDVQVELVVEDLEVRGLSPGVFSIFVVLIFGFWLRHAIVETRSDERVLAEQNGGLAAELSPDVLDLFRADVIRIYEDNLLVVVTQIP